MTETIPKPHPNVPKSKHNQPPRAGSDQCPECQRNGMVCYDSRPAVAEGVLRQRRKVCWFCGERVATSEVLTGGSHDQMFTAKRRARELAKEIGAEMDRFEAAVTRIGQRHLGDNWRRGNDTLHARSEE